MRAVLVLAVTLLATLGLAGPASAHASLIGSDPADGAVLQTAPTTVTLTFDDNLANFEPVVTVTGPDGTAYQTGTATVDGARRAARFRPYRPRAYTIAYRVVSDDGHPVEGTVTFESRDGLLAEPVPATAPTQVSSQPGSGPAGSAGTSSATPASASPAATANSATTAT